MNVETPMERDRRLARNALLRRSTPQDLVVLIAMLSEEAARKPDGNPAAMAQRGFKWADAMCRDIAGRTESAPNGLLREVLSPPWDSLGQWHITALLGWRAVRALMLGYTWANKHVSQHLLCTCHEPPAVEP